MKSKRNSLVFIMLICSLTDNQKKHEWNYEAFEGFNFSFTDWIVTDVQEKLTEFSDITAGTKRTGDSSDYYCNIKFRQPFYW